MDAETKALRDHFAGLALTGLLTTPMEGEIEPKVLASMAYEFADAMMGERFKGEEQAEKERAERRQRAHKDEQVRKAAHAKTMGWGSNHEHTKG